MPRQIITAGVDLQRSTVYTSLNISECFSRTIQGEGKFIGYPSIFLRLQGCVLNCGWCDSKEVWKKGNPFTVDEVIQLFKDHEVLFDLRNGHHLVVTGGSPLIQQNVLAGLFDNIQKEISSLPFIEVETECVIMPIKELIRKISWWNCSPKLANSGIPKKQRYKFDNLELMSKMNNVSFKFVVSNENDMAEIYDDFINPLQLDHKKVILMPEGQTRDELSERYSWLVDIATREGFVVSDRLHITIWNKKTGV